MRSAGDMQVVRGAWLRDFVDGAGNYTTDYNTKKMHFGKINQFKTTQSTTTLSVNFHVLCRCSVWQHLTQLVWQFSHVLVPKPWASRWCTYFLHRRRTDIMERSWLWQGLWTGMKASIGKVLADICKNVCWVRGWEEYLSRESLCPPVRSVRG